MSADNGEQEDPIVVDESDDDEDPIEEDQLNEYREMVGNLGVFPVRFFFFVLLSLKAKDR